ncbi:Sau3AI family type II restriction endonuclease [Methanobrevibacter sp. UBA337]|jgi:DNA mismatch repair protein MutH|uniref:Sau3AI family type II restriction endonuclease n=1 Tax=Methanobrevibacter sp. UBA337 TaxID=1915480 RepID=UPI0039B95679
MEYNSLDELLKKTETIKGKCINDIIKDENVLDGRKTLKKRKGFLGDLIETEFYQYPNNNVSEADFDKLGIELKTSGLKINKNGSISAKERLVLTMINYFDITDETFETSHLLEKNEKILILWYVYDKNKDIKDFKFVEYLLYSIYQDEIVIRNDYEIIQGKVINGLAHELSEGDTTYLGACTKSTKGSNRTQQPFLDYDVKPRAFCLKQKYMTSLIRDYYGNNLKHKRPKYNSVINYVYHKLETYFGKTQLEIAKDLGLKFDKVPKNLNKMISDRLIGKDNELNQQDSIFMNSVYLIKNCPVQEDYWPLERMTFPTFKFGDFDKNWEESYWKSYFEQLTMIIICFEGNRISKNGERILKSVKKVSFTNKDLLSIEKAFNCIKNAINQYNSDIVKKDLEDYVKLLPTPKKFKNQIIEIVPKASKGKNSYYNLFTGEKSTKTSFALTKPFLYKKFTQHKK